MRDALIYVAGDVRWRIFFVRDIKKNVDIILQKHGFCMVVFMLLLCNLYGIVSVVVLLMTFLLLAKVLGC